MRVTVRSRRVLVGKLTVMLRLGGVPPGFVVLSVRMVMRCLMVMMRRGVVVGRRQLMMIMSRMFSHDDCSSDNRGASARKRA